jgi:hypothetical protein
MNPRLLIIPNRSFHNLFPLEKTFVNGRQSDEAFRRFLAMIIQLQARNQIHPSPLCTVFLGYNEQEPARIYNGS